MSKKLKQMLAAYGLVLPSFLTVMLVVAWPILTAIKTSFTDPDTGGFTFDNYKYFFETPRELTNILFTLGIVFLTVALAIVLAYLLALYLRFVKSKVSRLIGNLYLLPRFVPSMVAVYAMITVVRDSGLLNRISQLFGGDFKPGMMYHASGLVTMNMWFNIPFAALMITAGLGAIPDSMIESARDVGAPKHDPSSFHEGRGHCSNIRVHVQRRFVYHAVFDGRQLSQDAGHCAVRSVQQVFAL